MPSARANDPQLASYKVRATGRQGSGTGVSKNLVVTNSHVVDRQMGAAATIQHLLSNRQMYGRVVAMDTDADLALIHVPTNDVQWVELSADPQRGQSCTAWGYPDNGPLRNGAGVFEKVGTRGNTSVPTWDLSVPVYSGHSGGGVFDNDGRLSAVIWAADQQTSKGTAIPVSYVMRLAQTLAPASSKAPDMQVAANCPPTPYRTQTVQIQRVQGPQGLQGPQGQQGPTGATGPQGLQGIPGRALTDDEKNQMLLALYAMIQNDPNMKGPQGLQGVPGAAAVIDDAAIAAIMAKMQIVLQYTDKNGQVVEESPFIYDAANKRMKVAIGPLPVQTYDFKGKLYATERYPLPWGIRLEPFVVDKDGNVVPSGLAR